MDLKQIRQFTYVANLRSFRKAAEALGVAQPALSRNIRALEEEFRTVLLHRTTRGVEPTVAGYTLLKMGEELLINVEEIRASVMRASNQPTGTVVVGVPPSLSTRLAPLIIQECQSACADVIVRIIEGLSVFLQEWLNLGRVDLAVMARFDQPDWLGRVDLPPEEMVFVAPASRAAGGKTTISIHDLATQEITTTHGFRVLINRMLANTDVKLKYTTDFDSILLIKEMLRRDLCVSVLPYAIVAEDREAGLFSILRVDPCLQRELFIGWNTRRPVSPAISAVRTAITRCELPSWPSADDPA